MHGRPRPFKGKYYSSIFIHYLPVDWALTAMDSQFMVREKWKCMPREHARGRA